MKVCIVTEGGRKKGFGHITRCTSIYQAFEEIGISPEFIVNGDGNVRGLLQDKNSKVFDWLNNREMLLAVVRNADVAFIDSYLADYGLYEKISKLVETGVYFDDDIRIEYPKGFVLNGTVLAKQMPYPKKKDVTYLLGPQYVPLRKAFWNIPAKLIHDNIETVMITFGGADIRNLTPRVLTWLTDMYPELLKKVIVGKGFQNITEIERLRDSNTELIYYPGAAEMRKVMLESDIAIAAGGQTLYELARIGVPTIGICVAENQLQNTQGWKEASFLEYAGRYDDEDLERRLKNSLRCLVRLSVRSERSRIGRKVVDGQGCKRIVKAVVSV